MGRGVEEDFRIKFKEDKMKLIAYHCMLIACYCFQCFSTFIGKLNSFDRIFLSFYLYYNKFLIVIERAGN